MRQVEQQVIGAFLSRKARTVGNTSTDGSVLWLHGNRIAEWIDRDVVRILDAGWRTVTTKSRLNALLYMAERPESIFQRQYEWFVFDADAKKETPWHGDLIFHCLPRSVQ